MKIELKRLNVRKIVDSEDKAVQLEKAGYVRIKRPSKTKPDLKE